jgi:uncharacterized protein YjcR
MFEKIIHLGGGGGDMTENYVKGENEYVRGMKCKETAEKYRVSLNTVKS